MTQARLTDDQRRDWLRLARTENVGPVAFRYLIQTYGEAAKAIGALPRMAERAGRAQPPRVPSPAEIDRELAAGAAIGAKLLCAGEPAFPPMLAAIDPPPPVIWAGGDHAEGDGAKQIAADHQDRGEPRLDIGQIRPREDRL